MNVNRIPHAAPALAAALATGAAAAAATGTTTAVAMSSVIAAIACAVAALVAMTRVAGPDRVARRRWLAHVAAGGVVVAGLAAGAGALV